MSRDDEKQQRSVLKMKKIKMVLLLTSAYFAAEVATGLVTGSLALIADAGHMLTDVGALALSLFAISYARRPPTPQRTYGFYRMEILASLANSLVLILLSAYILYEAYQRIFEPPAIQSPLMIAVAAVGLAVNFGGMKLLGEDMHSHGSHDHHHGKGAHRGGNKEENLNIEAARLEVFSDTLGSIGVITAGIVILTTKFYLADPIVSIGLALFILPRTWSLIKKSIHILMEGVPSNISYEAVKKAILDVRGVTGVFELHIWSITSGMNALSAHVAVIDPSRSQAILKEITAILENQFGIDHSTIQIESYHPESSSM
jgi:cobalt-zinc-cadmium efflux system protein